MPRPASTAVQITTAVSETMSSETAYTHSTPRPTIAIART